MKDRNRQMIAVMMVLLFLTQNLGVSSVYGQMVLNSSHAQMIRPPLSLDPVSPVVLRGLKVNPSNPLRFEFIVDRGQSNLTEEALKTESSKLVRYFLASLTVPEHDLWVNLSPQEKDRIIPTVFGTTEMGKELLNQDYLLKQLASSLTNPNTALGKKYWDEFDKQGKSGQGTEKSVVELLNRVWIVPEKAVIYQNQGTAFIGETHLKVMLEEDYKVPPPNLPHEGGGSTLVKSSPPQVGGVRGGGSVGTDAFRQLILPTIEKEVNAGQVFAPLRQVYHSLILAAWYKRALKQSVLSQVYVDKNKVAGVNLVDKKTKDQIYEQYLKAFRNGAYNLIHEEENEAGEFVPRKYFSGGMNFGGQIDSAIAVSSLAGNETAAASAITGPLTAITIDVHPQHSQPVDFQSPVLSASSGVVKNGFDSSLYNSDMRKFFITQHGGEFNSGWWISFDMDRAGERNWLGRHIQLTDLNLLISKFLDKFPGAKKFGTGQVARSNSQEEGFIYLPENLSQEDLERYLDEIRAEFRNSATDQQLRTVTFSAIKGQDISRAALLGEGLSQQDRTDYDVATLRPKYNLKVAVGILENLLRQGKGEKSATQNSRPQGYGDKTVIYSASAGVGRLPETIAKKMDAKFVDEIKNAVGILSKHKISVDRLKEIAVKDARSEFVVPQGFVGSIELNEDQLISVLRAMKIDGEIGLWRVRGTNLWMVARGSEGEFKRHNKVLEDDRITNVNRFVFDTSIHNHPGQDIPIPSNSDYLYFYDARSEGIDHFFIVGNQGMTDVDFNEINKADEDNFAGDIKYRIVSEVKDRLGLDIPELEDLNLHDNRVKEVYEQLLSLYEAKYGIKREFLAWEKLNAGHFRSETFLASEAFNTKDDSVFPFLQGFWSEWFWTLTDDELVDIARNVVKDSQENRQVLVLIHFIRQGDPDNARYKGALEIFLTSNFPIVRAIAYWYLHEEQLRGTDEDFVSVMISYLNFRPTEESIKSFLKQMDTIAQNLEGQPDEGTGYFSAAAEEFRKRWGMTNSSASAAVGEVIKFPGSLNASEFLQRTFMQNPVQVISLPLGDLFNLGSFRYALSKLMIEATSPYLGEFLFDLVHNMGRGFKNHKDSYLSTPVILNFYVNPDNRKFYLQLVTEQPQIEEQDWQLILNNSRLSLTKLQSLQHRPYGDYWQKGGHGFTVYANFAQQNPAALEFELTPEGGMRTTFWAEVDRIPSQKEVEELLQESKIAASAGVVNFTNTLDPQAAGIQDAKVVTERDVALLSLFVSGSRTQLTAAMITDSHIRGLLGMLIDELILNITRGFFGDQENYFKNSVHLRFINAKNGKKYLALSSRQPLIEDSQWRMIEGNAKLNFAQLKDIMSRGWASLRRNAGAGFATYAILAQARPAALQFEKDDQGGMTTRLWVEIDHILATDVLDSIFTPNLTSASSAVGEEILDYLKKHSVGGYYEDVLPVVNFLFNSEYFGVEAVYQAFKRDPESFDNRLSELARDPHYQSFITSSVQDLISHGLSLSTLKEYFSEDMTKFLEALRLLAQATEEGRKTIVELMIGQASLNTLLEKQNKKLYSRVSIVAGKNALLGFLNIYNIKPENIDIVYLSQQLITEKLAKAWFKGYPLSEYVYDQDRILFPTHFRLEFENGIEVPHSDPLHIYLPVQSFKFELPETFSKAEMDEMRQIMQIAPGRKIIVASFLQNQHELGILLNTMMRWTDSQRPLLILGFAHHYSKLAQSILENTPSLRVLQRTSLDELPDGSFNGLAQGQPMGKADIVVLSTIGELLKLYGLADVALLGEDRNIMEPASQGKVSISLPGDWNNNREARNFLLSHGATIPAEEDLFKQISELLNQPEKLSQADSQAKSAHNLYRAQSGLKARFYTAATLAFAIDPALRASSASAAVEGVNHLQQTPTWGNLYQFFKAQQGIFNTGWWIHFDMDKASDMDETKSKDVLHQLNQIIYATLSHHRAQFFSTPQNDAAKFKEEGYVYLPNSLSEERLYVLLESIRKELKEKTQETVTLVGLRAADIAIAAHDGDGLTESQHGAYLKASPQDADYYMWRAETMEAILNRESRKAKGPKTPHEPLGPKGIPRPEGYGDKAVIYSSSSAVGEMNELKLSNPDRVIASSSVTPEAQALINALNQKMKSLTPEEQAQASSIRNFVINILQDPIRQQVFTIWNGPEGLARRMGIIAFAHEHNAAICDLTKRAGILDQSVEAIDGITFPIPDSSGNNFYYLILDDYIFKDPVKFLTVFVHEFIGHILADEIFGKIDVIRSEMRAFTLEKEFLSVVLQNLPYVDELLSAPAQATGISRAEKIREAAQQSQRLKEEIEYAQQQIIHYKASQQRNPERDPSASSAVEEVGGPVRLNQDVGGINLDPNKLNLDVRGQVEDLPLPTDLKALENLNFDGLSPVIINMTPMNPESLFIFLGKATAESPPPVALSRS